MAKVLAQAEKDATDAVDALAKTPDSASGRKYEEMAAALPRPHMNLLKDPCNMAPGHGRKPCCTPNNTLCPQLTGASALAAIP